MNIPFHEALRRLRIEKGLSQQQLAEALSVDRSTVTKWETGDRQPDAETIARLSSVLGSNVGALLGAARASGETPQVILVDDERIILTGGLPVLRSALPGAEVTGFTDPAKAVAFARENPVALVFLDIEMAGSAAWTCAGSCWRSTPTPTSSSSLPFRSTPLTPGSPGPAAI